jgi:hypothetical protein
MQEAGRRATVAEADVKDDEQVRVLTPRARRQRHRAEDEAAEVTPAPGAAAAGARQLEPAAGSQELPIARILAVGALALAVLIVLVLIVGKL